jgi:hypothetical protein
VRFSRSALSADVDSIIRIVRSQLALSVRDLST